MSSQLKGPFSFPKSERLHGKKAVDLLFGSGRAWLVYPFRVVITETEIPEGAAGSAPKILISVSKKIFKKAHDRNRIKRQIREAYRTQKPAFISQLSGRSSESLPKQINVGFIYIAKTQEAFSLISAKMKRALNEIASRV